jgi:hypothetical protein
MNGKKRVETERKYDTYYKLIRVETKVITPSKDSESVISFVKPKTEEDFKLKKTALFSLSYDISDEVNAIDKRATS